MVEIDRNRYLFILVLFTGILLSFFQISYGNLRYDIQASLDNEKRTISGKEEITFTNPLDSQVKDIVLVIRANLLREPNPRLSEVSREENYPRGFDPGWTELTGPITQEGEKVNYTWESLPPAGQTYSLEKTAVRISLSEPLNPGESTSISINFSTKFPHRNGVDQEYYKETYIWRFGWYPTLAPASWWKEYDEEIYGQTKLPSGDYNVELELPCEFKVAGNLVSEESPNLAEEDERKLVQVELKSARSFPLVASPRFKEYRGKFKEFTIQVLYYPGYEEEARSLATHANDILTYYSERFGKYQRKQLSFAQGPTSGYYGLAADGTIVLGNSFFTESDLLVDNFTNRLSEYLVAHEVAHQWFGIGVGADLNSQNWLSEAFAEFLSLRYFESKYSPDKPNLFKIDQPGLVGNLINSQLGYVNLRKHMFELQYVLNYDKGFDEAVIKPTEEVEYGNASQTRLYKKGYLILRSLESIVGKKTMTEILKKTYEAHNGDIIDASRFAAIVKSTSGEPLPKDFFEEWLYTNGYLNYGIEGFQSTEGEDGNYNTEIDVTKDGSLTAPVTLQLQLKSDENVKKRVKLESKQKEITVTTNEKVTGVTVDPEQEVMDTNRINNHYPRKVKVSFSKNSLPLDAHFITVGLGTVQGRELNRFIWAIGPGLAQGTLNLNRNITLSGQAALGGNKLSNLYLEGGFSAKYKFWSTPKTGYASTHWVQDKSLAVQYNRVHDRQMDKSYNILGLQGNLNQELSANRQLSGRIDTSPSGFSKLSLSASETSSLLPNVHIDMDASLGFGVGEIPDLLEFKLTELKSFGKYEVDEVGLISWKPDLFPGNYKLFAKMTLDFPLLLNGNYYLGTLAKVSEIRQGVFISAGDTWNELDQFGVADFKVEGGLEVGISGTTLGGMFPFDLTLGYAYHGQDAGRPFISFALGL